MVPKEWISPPDHETNDGELLEEEEDDDDDEDSDENAGMLENDRRRRRESERRQQYEQHAQNSEDAESSRSLATGGKRISTDHSPPPRVVSLTDSAGRPLPVAERAPLRGKT